MYELDEQIQLILIKRKLVVVLVIVVVVVRLVSLAMKQSRDDRNKSLNMVESVIALKPRILSVLVDGLNKTYG